MGSLLRLGRDVGPWLVTWLGRVLNLRHQQRQFKQLELGSGSDPAGRLGLWSVCCLCWGQREQQENPACRQGRVLVPTTTESQDPLGRVRIKLVPGDFFARARA